MPVDVLVPGLRLADEDTFYAAEAIGGPGTFRTVYDSVAAVVVDRREAGQDPDEIREEIVTYLGDPEFPENLSIYRLALRLALENTE